MTLEELDEVLKKTNLNLDHPKGKEIRDAVLRLHGTSLLSSKQDRCSHCWFKDNGRCNPGCELYGMDDDPIEVSKHYLSAPNDISPFVFFCMFVIPVYEHVTGQKDCIKKFSQHFFERWKKEYGESPKSSYF